MAFSDFLNDPGAVRNFGEWWVFLYLTNPAGAEEVVRISRHGTPSPSSAITAAGISVAANTPFVKRLLRAPEVTHNLWQPGSIGGATFPAFGPMLLNNRDGGLDQYKPTTGYKWADRRCVALFLDRRDPVNTAGKVFDGRLAMPRYSLTDVIVNLRGNDIRFQVPISQKRYRGSSYMLELFGDRTVSYGTPAAVQITGNMTGSRWIWLEALASTNFVSWGWIGGAGAAPWRLAILSNGKLQLFGHVSGVQESVTSTVALAALKPYHITFTIDGRDVTFYVWDDDAQTLTTELYTNAFSSATRDASGAGYTYMDRTNSDATYKPWIDESQVWNVARTADQIADNRYSPLATIPASCVHYVKMDDGSGTTVTDSSATGANGTISGAGTSAWLWAMEGTAELAKTPKPGFWGQQPGLPGIIVDPIGANGPSGPTYQVAGHGAMQSITPNEGANPITVSSNAASYRAFIVSAPAAGQAITYLARGLVKLGSQPTLPVTFDCEGYNGGALGYVSTAPTITRDLVTRFGPKLTDPGDLDTTAFTDYVNAVAGAVMGLYVADPTTERAMGEALDACARSGGLGYWGYDRGSEDFTVGRFGGAGTVSNHDFTKRHIVRGTLRERDSEAVVWKVVVRFQPRLVVLSEEQVAAAVKGTAGWQVHTQAWQEADAADQSLRDAYPNDGSRVVTIDTGIYTRAAAQALADTILAALKGLRQGWDVTVVANGQQVLTGQTVTLEFTNQFGVQRLGLDGLTRLAVLTTKDAPQRGEVALELWG
jgi:hypothetical protein